MPRCPPILKRSYTSPRTMEHENVPSKPWTAFILPAFAVFLLLLPQPSWFILVSSHYDSGIIQLIHIGITTLLTLGAFSSLAICCFADPGRPTADDLDAAEEAYIARKKSRDEERDALMEDEEDEDPNSFNSSHRWCRTCWAPKPDRTHHCSTCGRCVLVLDHHCVWISQCVGHRTYPTFLHLLFCVTLLALYITVVCCTILYSFLFTPIAQPIDDIAPLHCLLLVVMGFVFSIVIGSFFAFHLYLCFTNQTTLEQLSPFLLLRYLPKPKIPRHAPGTSITHNIPDATPSSRKNSPYHFPSPPPTPPVGGRLDTRLTPPRVFSSSPVATTAGPAYIRAPVSRDYREWDEHSLSSSQRRLVRYTASQVRLWDLGWKANISAKLGAGNSSHGTTTRRHEGNTLRPYSWKWWLAVVLYGGPPRGDGKTFPRNKRARGTLQELRMKLEQLEHNERGDMRDEGNEEEHELNEVR